MVKETTVSLDDYAHRPIVQIRRMEILLLYSFFYVLLCSSMRARNSKYLIARVSFWEGNQRKKYSTCRECFENEKQYKISPKSI